MNFRVEGERTEGELEALTTITIVSDFFFITNMAVMLPPVIRHRKLTEDYAPFQHEGDTEFIWVESWYQKLL